MRLRRPRCRQDNHNTWLSHCQNCSIGLNRKFQRCLVSLEAERYNAASQVVSQVGGGVSINIPWLNGKKYRAEEREAQNELSAAVNDVLSAQTEALGRLRNQLEKIETLHHHIELYRDNLLPTARQTVDSYQADYETDKATLLSLLSSQRNLRDLQTMYFQDLSDYRV